MELLMKVEQQNMYMVLGDANNDEYSSSLHSLFSSLFLSPGRQDVEQIKAELKADFDKYNKIEVEKGDRIQGGEHPSVSRQELKVLMSDIIEKLVAMNVTNLAIILQVLKGIGKKAQMEWIKGR